MKSFLSFLLLSLILALGHSWGCAIPNETKIETQVILGSYSKVFITAEVAKANNLQSAQKYRCSKGDTTYIDLTTDTRSNRFPLARDSCSTKQVITIN